MVKNYGEESKGNDKEEGENKVKGRRLEEER